MRSPAFLLAATLVWTGKADASCDWRASERLQISGDYKEGSLEGSFNRILAPASGRYSEAIDLRVLKRGSGFDGRLAWSRDVSGASHYLTSDFARRLAVSEAWLASHLSCPAPNGTHTRAVAGTGLSVRRFTPAGGAPIELWYERRTGRLDRASLQYSENHLIHHYADWRKVASGQLLPFKQRDEDPEDESETIYTIGHVAVVNSASFTPPPPPQDSTIVDGTSTTIPFEDDGGHRVYLPVYLNGKGPFAFELDNGGHFILTSATAKELSLAPQGSFSSTGAGTEIRQAGYVNIRELRVGKADVVNQTAKVLPLSHNDRPGLPPRAGILGLELFERFVVTVDQRSKTVSLELPSRSSKKHPGRPLHLMFDEDAPLVAGGFAGATGNVMLDIGNAGSTIVEYYWAKQNRLVSRLASGAKTDDEWLSTGIVSLGPFSLKSMKVAYFGQLERGSESTRSVAAIAGEPLLSRFNAIYDYGRQTVWLDPLRNEEQVSTEKQP